MYLSDLIREPINKILKDLLVNKKVKFRSQNFENVVIHCKNVLFEDDDGDCWIKFTDSENKEYYAEGQGIDTWFKIIE